MLTDAHTSFATFVSERSETLSPIYYTMTQRYEIPEGQFEPPEGYIAVYRPSCDIWYFATVSGILKSIQIVIIKFFCIRTYNSVTQTIHIQTMTKYANIASATRPVPKSGEASPNVGTGLRPLHVFWRPIVFFALLLFQYFFTALRIGGLHMLRSSKL